MSPICILTNPGIYISGMRVMISELTNQEEPRTSRAACVASLAGERSTPGKF